MLLQGTALDQGHKVIEKQGQSEKAPTDHQVPWQQDFQGQPQLAPLHDRFGNARIGQPGVPPPEQGRQLLAQLQGLGLDGRPAGQNSYPGQPEHIFSVPQHQQQDFPSIVGFGGQQQQQPAMHEQQQQHFPGQVNEALLCCPTHSISLFI